MEDYKKHFSQVCKAPLKWSNYIEKFTGQLIRICDFSHLYCIDVSVS